jgi:hypothetical protein
MQLRFAFPLYFSLLGCSWDVDVGPQGRYEPSGTEGLACAAGVESFYDAGPGAIVDRLSTIYDPDAKTTSIYVALRAPGEEIRRLTLRFGGVYSAVTVERDPDARGAFSDLIVGISLDSTAYFTNDGAVGALAGFNYDDAFQPVPITAPLLIPASHPVLLGPLDMGKGAPLAVWSAENGGRVSTLAFGGSGSPGSATVVVQGAFAAFPWWQGAESEFVSYAEATPDGVVLHSVRGTDPNDATSVTLPDAEPASFHPLHAVGRVLFFQYVPKGTPSPSSLPLLAVDLAANDLGPNAPLRAPHVITPALAAQQNAVLRADDWMIAAYSTGDYARVSLPDGAITPLPEVAGAIAFAYDTCNLYWITKDSAVVMAMPLPGKAK